MNPHIYMRHGVWCCMRRGTDDLPGTGPTQEHAFEVWKALKDGNEARMHELMQDVLCRLISEIRVRFVRCR